MKRLKKLYSREWFLRRVTSSADKRRRKDLFSAFSAIEKRIPCEHESREMAVMADFILSAAPPGALVECGCYLGSSSAKLSLLAEATGRDLYVCDSFEGLPEVTSAEASFVSVTNRQNGFTKGQWNRARQGETPVWLSGLARAMRNLRRYRNL